MFEFVKKCWDKGKNYCQKGVGAVTAAVAAVGVGVVGVASPAKAEMTSLIDFSAIAADITPILTSAVTIAAGVGALVLAARLAWGFFKKFARG